MLPSETMIWQPEFTDKTLSRKTGAVHSTIFDRYLHNAVVLSGFFHHRTGQAASREIAPIS
ncbi:hypothetical protein C9Z90_24875 [Escherichia coli]|uniref:hypothetical protein n=1 Tax=Escherichia coli TaxID=562 RepID=UPI00098A0DBC|nr:hypothetical protein [Escherichia coli]EFL7505239.1 hypothetical protein [Escherichia coli]TJN97720.1 hypothetical protein C9010_25345 [Escherichia coli]TJO40424.1 hypothetical protein C9003_25355 [Escherichia coli]TJP01367.1 hypothetical protein C9Z90_24875 [Escherichia coli]